MMICCDDAINMVHSCMLFVKNGYCGRNLQWNWIPKIWLRNNLDRVCGGRWSSPPCSGSVFRAAVEFCAATPPFYICVSFFILHLKLVYLFLNTSLQLDSSYFLFYFFTKFFNSIFFSCCGHRGLNPRFCIYFALSLPTELSSHEYFLIRLLYFALYVS